MCLVCTQFWWKECDIRVQAGYCILKRCNLIIFLFFYKGVFLFFRPICVQIASLIIALSGIHHRNGSKQSLSIKILFSYFYPIYISKIQSLCKKLNCLRLVFFIIHIFIGRKWWWSQSGYFFSSTQSGKFGQNFAKTAPSEPFFPFFPKILLKRRLRRRFSPFFLKFC